MQTIINRGSCQGNLGATHLVPRIPEGGGPLPLSSGPVPVEGAELNGILTPAQSNISIGCFAKSGIGQLTDDTFIYQNTAYRIEQIYWRPNNTLRIDIHPNGLNTALPDNTELTIEPLSNPGPIFTATASNAWRLPPLHRLHLGRPPRTRNRTNLPNRTAAQPMNGPTLACEDPNDRSCPVPPRAGSPGATGNPPAGRRQAARSEPAKTAGGARARCSPVISEEPGMFQSGVGAAPPLQHRHPARAQHI